MTSKSAKLRPFCFLQLPAEIRNNILELAALDGLAVTLPPTGIPDHALLHFNKQLRAEAFTFVCKHRALLYHRPNHRGLSSVTEFWLRYHYYCSAYEVVDNLRFVLIPSPAIVDLDILPAYFAGKQIVGKDK